MSTLNCASAELSKIRLWHNELYLNGTIPAQPFPDVPTLEAICDASRKVKAEKIIICGAGNGMILRTLTLVCDITSIVCVDDDFVAFEESFKVLPTDFSGVRKLNLSPNNIDFSTLWDSYTRVLLIMDKPEYIKPLFTQKPAMASDSHGILTNAVFLGKSINPHEYVHKNMIEPNELLGSFDYTIIPCCSGNGSIVCPTLAYELATNLCRRNLGNCDHSCKAHMFSIQNPAQLYGQPEDAEQNNTRLETIKHNPLGDLIERSPLLPRDKYSPQADTLIENAIKLYGRGNFGTALGLIDNAVKLMGTQCGLLGAEALCAAAAGFEEIAQKLLNIDPVSDRTRERLRHQIEIKQLKKRASHIQNLKQLTIFTSPKAFEGIFGPIQERAIKSWLQLVPTPEIIIFGDEPGTEATAEKFGLKHIPHVPSNEFGTPLVNELFNLAQDHAANDILVYINADIIVLDDFVPQVSRAARLFDEFLLVGQRRDIQLDEDFSLDQIGWQNRLRHLIVEQAQMHSPGGIDYFAFTKNLWTEIKPFALGRCAWDNWLVFSIMAARKPVIDATKTISIVHQDHDYSHFIKDRKSTLKTVQETPEAMRNKELAGEEALIGITTAAPLVLLPDGFKRRTKIGEF